MIAWECRIDPRVESDSETLMRSPIAIVRLAASWKTWPSVVQMRSRDLPSDPALRRQWEEACRECLAHGAAIWIDDLPWSGESPLQPQWPPGNPMTWPLGTPGAWEAESHCLTVEAGEMWWRRQTGSGPWILGYVSDAQGARSGETIGQAILATTPNMAARIRWSPTEWVVAWPYEDEGLTGAEWCRRMWLVLEGIDVGVSLVTGDASTWGSRLQQAKRTRAPAPGGRVKAYKSAADAEAAQQQVQEHLEIVLAQWEEDTRCIREASERLDAGDRLPADRPGTAVNSEQHKPVSTSSAAVPLEAAPNAREAMDAEDPENGEEFQPPITEPAMSFEVAEPSAPPPIEHARPSSSVGNENPSRRAGPPVLSHTQGQEQSTETVAVTNSEAGDRTDGTMVVMHRLSPVMRPSHWRPRAPMVWDRAEAPPPPVRHRVSPPPSPPTPGVVEAPASPLSTPPSPTADPMPITPSPRRQFKPVRVARAPSPRVRPASQPPAEAPASADPPRHEVGPPPLVVVAPSSPSPLAIPEGEVLWIWGSDRKVGVSTAAVALARWLASWQTTPVRVLDGHLAHPGMANIVYRGHPQTNPVRPGLGWEAMWTAGLPGEAPPRIIRLMDGAVEIWALGQPLRIPDPQTRWGRVLQSMIGVVVVVDGGTLPPPRPVKAPIYLLGHTVYRPNVPSGTWVASRHARGTDTMTLHLPSTPLDWEGVGGPEWMAVWEPLRQALWPFSAIESSDEGA